jgi:hypothetical protein
MSCDEIRWWLCELRRRGWNSSELQRALAIRGNIGHKASGRAWIYPTEQIRMSHVLRRIISGELVLGPPRWTSHSTWRCDAMLATRPEPLRMPLKMVFDFHRGRLALTPSHTPPENPLPSFKTLLNNPRRWVDRGGWHKW